MADDFEALPPSLRLQIDAAFDAALASASSTRLPPNKRRKLTSAPEPEPAGGFIVEGDDNPGGFVFPSSSSSSSDEDLHRYEDDPIPFPLIPTALQILDLPPDDPEVLQVFRNAAGGWSNVAESDDTDVSSGMQGEGGVVNRKDWRAICAVIVGNREEDGEAEGGVAGGFVIEDEHATSSEAEISAREADGEEEGDEEEEDAYEGSSLSSFSDDSDSDSDSYLAGPSTSKSRTKTNGRKFRRTHRVSPAPGGPTPRQKRAALEAFALFFPSSPSLSDIDLVKKRLMFKDIVRVAEVLKEKIKAEEITEMLSLFSTAPDKSVSFDDFTRMMIMAKFA